MFVKKKQNRKQDIYIAYDKKNISHIWHTLFYITKRGQKGKLQSDNLYKYNN